MTAQVLALVWIGLAVIWGIFMAGFAAGQGWERADQQGGWIIVGAATFLTIMLTLYTAVGLF